MARTFKSILVVVILCLIQATVIKAQDSKNPFVGKWETVISGLPQGDMAGLLKIESNEDKLSGSFTDKMTKRELVFTSVALKDSVLLIGFSYQGMVVTMTLTKKDEDTIEGLILDNYKVNAVRIKE